MNIQSMQAKRESMWEVIISSNADVVVGCETWLATSILDSEVMPGNYNVYRKDRGDAYGGVLVAVRDDLIS